MVLGKRKNRGEDELTIGTVLDVLEGVMALGSLYLFLSLDYSSFLIVLSVILFLAVIKIQVVQYKRLSTIEAFLVLLCVIATLWYEGDGGRIVIPLLTIVGAVNLSLFLEVLGIGFISFYSIIQSLRKKLG